MKKALLFLIIVAGLVGKAQAQYIYKIKADSLLVTNDSCTAELNLENSTKNVLGFLYNKGNGRTEFRRAVTKINDSLYLIGADTLRVGSPNAWKQGGNSFGATGILGTLDTNHMDIYTNGLPRARFTKTGNFLLGTTTDNGNLLNVNGTSYFGGNVNIGTATITPAGNLINTNAILFNHFISEYHNYAQVDPFISKLDNVLYNYNTRFNTTYSTDASGNTVIDIVIPDYEIVPGYNGIVYPQGVMAFSFWANGIPQGVSVMMKNVNGNWYGPYATTTNQSPNTFGFFKIDIPGSFNFTTEIKITITPSSPGAYINLQNIEYALINGPQGLMNGLPFVGKYGQEILYNYFYFRNGGADNVRISPYASVPNYFLNNTLLGTTSDNGNKLQVTGNANINGNFTVSGNGIAFPGLSGNNSASRILAADANGYLYFRDASSLAMGNTIPSDLAVQGTLHAQNVQIAAHDPWPDYVFNAKYKLPSLAQVEQYIHEHQHLPGMQSAATVKKEGIDVADTQAALLKKVEELTLYVIQQQKEINSLKKQVTELKTSKKIRRLHK